MPPARVRHADGTRLAHHVRLPVLPSTTGWALRHTLTNANASI